MKDIVYKSLKEAVNTYKTKYPQGFTQDEHRELFSRYPKINMDKVKDALTGITGQVEDGQFITYHCDVLQALVCGVENRNQTQAEFD